jgi:hypothetical protein
MYTGRNKREKMGVIHRIGLGCKRREKNVEKERTSGDPTEEQERVRGKRENKYAK